jgi:hypothetical protein
VPIRIPTGFRPKAQGCEARATLGRRSASIINRNAVVTVPFSSATRGLCRNPVGVDDNLIPCTQGSSCLATLVYVLESRWDSLWAANFVRVNSAIGNFNVIPREILKKIRQNVIRTNRIVTEFVERGCVRSTSRSTPDISNAPTNRHALRLGLRPQPRSSFQPPAQLRRIPRAVENRSHVGGIQFNRIIDAVFTKSLESCFVSRRRGEAKAFRGFQNLLERCVNFDSKFVAQAGMLFFLPRCRVFKFQASKGRKDDCAIHALRLFRRSWSSACTVSHEIPRSGCCRSSSARRSSSATWSGVSSSSKYSSRTFSATSYCSANGRRRICSMISVAFMALKLFAVRHFASA